MHANLFENSMSGTVLAAGRQAGRQAGSNLGTDFLREIKQITAEQL